MSAEPTGYFATEWHDAAQRCAEPWRPMLDLATPSPAWEQRIAATRTALATSAGVPTDNVERRVAASVVHLGVCARIIAPALAGAVCERRVVDTALERLWWQPTLGGPFPLSMPRESLEPEPNPASASTGQLVHSLRRGLIDITMATLVRAARRYSVSSLIGWGNVSSTLQSAARMLESADPGRAVDARAVVAGISAFEPLSAAGRLDGQGGFRRNSCCLIYRVAGDRATAICGDCVLGGDHQRSPSRQSQVISASRSSGAAAGNT